MKKFMAMAASAIMAVSAITVAVPAMSVESSAYIHVFKDETAPLTFKQARLCTRNWYRAAEKYAKADDLDRFASLYGKGWGTEAIKAELDFFKNEIVSGKTKYSYKVATVSGNEAVTDICFYSADRKNSRSVTLTFAAENGLYVLSNTRSTLANIEYNSFNESIFGKEYASGFTTTNYWAKYEKSILDGVNADVQKAKVNADGSFTAVITVANGLDHAVNNVRMFNTKGFSTISFGKTSECNAVRFDLCATVFEGTLKNISNVTIPADSAKTFTMTIPAGLVPKGLTNADLAKYSTDFHFSYNNL